MVVKVKDLFTDEELELITMSLSLEEIESKTYAKYYTQQDIINLLSDSINETQELIQELTSIEDSSTRNYIIAKEIETINLKQQLIEKVKTLDFESVKLFK